MIFALNNKYTKCNVCKHSFKERFSNSAVVQKLIKYFRFLIDVLLLGFINADMCAWYLMGSKNQNIDTIYHLSDLANICCVMESTRKCTWHPGFSIQTILQAEQDSVRRNGIADNKQR